MRVLNNNLLPYALLLVNGSYATSMPGEEDDLDIHPSKIEEYRSKGFTIDGEGSETPEIEPGTADWTLAGGSITPNPETGVSGENTNDGTETSDEETADEAETDEDEAADDDAASNSEEVSVTEEIKEETPAPTSNNRRNRRR